MTINDQVHEEQSDAEEEESEERVPQRARPERPEALVDMALVDMIDVHFNGFDTEDPGFFQESLDFWSRIWSSVPVSSLKNSNYSMMAHHLLALVDIPSWIYLDPFVCGIYVIT